MTARVRTWVWMIPLLLLAGWLGARLLDSEALRYDERWTLYNAGGDWYAPLSVGEVWQRIADDDPWQSPGYFIVLNVWGGLVGWSVAAARAFSLLTGLLAAAWMYRLGSELAGKRVGLYAAVALVGSAFFLYYLHEMRPYTLYALFTCMGAWAYWRTVYHAGGWPVRVLLVVSLAGLAYTHPLALLPGLALGLYHVLFVAGRRPGWIMPLLLMGLAALLYAPWITVILRAVGIASEDTVRQAVSLSAWEIISQFPVAFSSGSVALLAVLAAFAPSHRPAFRLVAVWLVSGLAAVLLINLLLPVFVHVRYLMALWPALALLVALGVDALAKRGVSPAIPLTVWLIAGSLAALTPDFFASFRNSERSIPWDGGLRESVAHIRSWADEQDAVIVHTRPPGLEWQNLGVLETWFNGLPLLLDNIETMHPNSEARERAYERRMVETLAPMDTVWTVVLSDVARTQRQAVFFEALDQEFDLCATPIDLADAQLRVYARPPDFDDTNSAEFVAEDGEIRANAAKVQSGQNSLRVVLAWQLDDSVPRGTYNAFIHVVESSGAVLAQGDVAVPDTTTGCTASVIDLTGIETSEASLIYGVYAWRTVERITLSSGGDSVFVQTVTIR